MEAEQSKSAKMNQTFFVAFLAQKTILFSFDFQIPALQLVGLPSRELLLIFQEEYNLITSVNLNQALSQGCWFHRVIKEH